MTQTPDTAPRTRLERRDLRLLAILAILAVLVLGSAALWVWSAIDRLVSEQGKQAAISWAELVRDTLPNLAENLRARSPSVEAEERFSRPVNRGPITHYRVYDRDGYLTDGSDPNEIGTRTCSPAFLATIASASGTGVVGKTGGGDGPTVYADAFVPILWQNTAIGVLEVRTNLDGPRRQGRILPRLRS